MISDNTTFNGNDTTVYDQLYESNFSPFLVVSTVVSLISNIICSYFLIFKLTLNAYIKLIYYLMNCLNITIMIVQVGALSYILQTHEQTLLPCTLIFFSELSGFLFNLEMPSIISIIKFYMSWKASKTRIAKPIVIQSIIIFALIYFGLSMIGFITSIYYYKMRSAFTLCANRQDFNQDPYYSTPAGCHILIILLIGLISDISLYSLVEKRKISSTNGQASNIIPWKVTANKEEAGIPKRTSLITFGTLVFFLIVVLPSFYFVILSKATGMWFPVIMFTLWMGFQLPFLLFFTIKHQKENVVTKQPPKVLQFHDDVETMNDVEAMNNEVEPPQGLQFHDDGETMNDVDTVHKVEQSCQIPTVSNQIMSIRILPDPNQQTFRAQLYEEIEMVTVLPGQL